MISIPTWFFVILVVLAAISVFGFALICTGFFIGWIVEVIKKKRDAEFYYENPDENPEYIPTEHN